MAMRRVFFFLVLVALFGVIMGQMWFGPGGVPKVSALEQQLAAQKAANQKTRLENEQLSSEVDDLKNGLGMVEEKARNELGMVRPNEIFVQVMPQGPVITSAPNGGPVTADQPPASAPPRAARPAPRVSARN